MKGFTLIELVIALFLISVAVVGSVAVLQQIILSNSLSSSKLVATYLAQEGLEIVRNIRDTEWLLQGEHDWGGAPWTGCGSGCSVEYDTSGSFGTDQDNYLKIGINGFYNYETGVETKFKRKVTIDAVDIPPLDGNADRLEVAVEVTWEERGRTHKVTVREDLYNWFRLISN